MGYIYVVISREDHDMLVGWRPALLGWRQLRGIACIQYAPPTLATVDHSKLEDFSGPAMDRHEYVQQSPSGCKLMRLAARHVC